MNAISIEEMLGWQYDVLGHGLTNEQTELRIFEPYPKQIFCKGKDDFINEASVLCGSNLYVGINPRHSDNGNAASIYNLTCLVIDIDPIREKDTPSTEEQHKGSVALGQRIASDLGGFTISSGSGTHIYVPIEPVKVTDWEALTESLKMWMGGIRDKYAPKGKSDFKIDHIFDLPRVIRVWGSLNTRSNRLCGPSAAPKYTRIKINFSQTPQAKAKNTAQVPTSTTPILERFHFLVKNNKRLEDIVNGNIDYPSASEADFEFVATLAKAQFSVDEIKSLFTQNPRGNKEPKKGDVERIVKKVLTESKETGESNAVSFTHNSQDYRNSLLGRKMGYRTGIKPLDEMISGLQRGKLYIFAARPGDGKTTLGVQIGKNLAEQYGTVSGHFTEIGYAPVFDKIVSRSSGVDLRKFQNGTFLEDDRKRIDTVLSTVEKLPFIVIEDFTVTIDKIEKDIKKYAPTVHIIDFFQALTWNDPQSASEKYAGVKRIKQVAQKMDIPIILMSQLARSKDKPSLASLSETKALEEYGDVISVLHTKERLSKPRKVYLDVLKSKYSENGLIRMDFHCNTCEFKEGLWTD
jgi:KaiC/GvpD/RAD55 family RecA-like ATPase